MSQQPATFGAVVGLVNKLQQICTQLGDTAGNSILVDKLSSIVVVGGQVGSWRLLGACGGPGRWLHTLCVLGPTVHCRSCSSVPCTPPSRPWIACKTGFRLL